MAIPVISDTIWGMAMIGTIYILGPRREWEVHYVVP